MDLYLDKVILNDVKIRTIVNKLSKKINNYYRDNKLVEVFVLLDGAKKFAQDIFSTNKIKSEKFNINLIKVKSYKKRKSTNNVEIEDTDLSYIKNKNVLIIDDIYETGNTLYCFKNHLKEYNPKDIKICVLLQRDNKHLEDIYIDFLGVIIKDMGFLVGYGLDYEGKYRNIPLIATLSS